MKTHDVAQAALSLPLQSHEGDTTRVHAQCLWHSQSCFYGVSPVGFKSTPRPCRARLDGPMAEVERSCLRLSPMAAGVRPAAAGQMAL